MQRVLLVEDELLISMLVMDWLSELGLEPLGPAQSVAAALEIVNTGPLDAAIVDVRVGDERCEPVAEALRERRVPFALTSGSNSDELAKRFEALFLPKPFDFDALKATVQRMLAKA